MYDFALCARRRRRCRCNVFNQDGTGINAENVLPPLSCRAVLYGTLDNRHQRAGIHTHTLLYPNHRANASLAVTRRRRAPASFFPIGLSLSLTLRVHTFRISSSASRVPCAHRDDGMKGRDGWDGQW